MLERFSQDVESERTFWKGTDIEAATDVVLGTTARIPILIHSESLPPMDGLDPDHLYFLHGSVRSRWAQLGVDLEEEVGPRIAEALAASVSPGSEVTSSFFGEAVLHNRATRSIYIPKGARIFRLYYDIKESAL